MNDKIRILEEKPDVAVSAWWKAGHIFCFFLICVASFVTAAIAANLQQDFSGQCILFSSPVVSEIVDNTISFGVKSHWAGDANCNLVTYVSAVSTIVSFFFLLMFIMCGHGGRRTTQGFGMNSPWRIVIPATVFSLFTSIPALVASTYITRGYAVFCDALVKTSRLTSCAETSGMKWKDHPQMFYFYGRVQGTEAAAWVMSATWLVSLCLLVVRCVNYVDFQPEGSDCQRETILGSISDQEEAA